MTVRLIRNRDALEVDLIGLRDMGQDLIQGEGDDRESLTADFLAWDKRASITLRQSFHGSSWMDPTPASSFADFRNLNYPMPENYSDFEGNLIQQDVEVKIRRIEDILQTLHLYEGGGGGENEGPHGATDGPAQREPEPAATGHQPQRASSNSVGNDAAKRVFVIHGRDEILRLEVEDLIHKATDGEPVILAQEANQGMTIIEKLETTLGSQSDHAVVLLSGDDFGGLNGDDSSPRARQNVILELGFAMARLGRNRVTLLRGEGVEMPSDVAGMSYHPTTDSAWKVSLLSELKISGFTVDHGKI